MIRVVRGSVVALMSLAVIASGARVGATAAQETSRPAVDAGTDAADQRTFAGRVVGPDGEAVPGLEVLLHRVTNQGGAQLARSTTSDDGRFALRYQPPVDADGVYFVATRYDGRVYIGPMLRAPFTDPADYVVQVGVPGVGDVEALMQRSPSGPPTGSGVAEAPSPAPGAAFVAVMLSAAIAIGIVLVTRGAGPSMRRRALIGLAELEESGTSQASPSEVARRRRELLRRAREA